MDRKIWQVFDLDCVFLWVLLIALNAICLSCVPSLLHWIFKVFHIFLISFQIWKYLFNFHASHICIFQLKLLALLGWVFTSSCYIIMLATFSQTVLYFNVNEVCACMWKYHLLVNHCFIFLHWRCEHIQVKWNAFERG